MIDPTLLQAKWNQALNYSDYLKTGTPEQQRRWNEFHAAVRLTPDQTQLLQSFTRSMKLLTISGIWCGDCVQQIPFLNHITTAAGGKIEHKLVDRDLHKDLSSQLHICGGNRVPVVLLLSEDCDFCALAGDRTLARYRRKATRELGPACSTGLFIPPEEEIAATLTDWLDEVERVQLMLRLSPRYRTKYSD